MDSLFRGWGAVRWWRGKQRKGKLYSIARLAKASFTFAGGADYIAWKINRHAGTAIELKPWQRRHRCLPRLPFCHGCWVGRRSLNSRRARCETAVASALTVNGLRSSS